MAANESIESLTPVTFDDLMRMAGRIDLTQPQADEPRDSQ